MSVIFKDDFKYVKEHALPDFSFCEIGEEDDLLSNSLIDELWEIKKTE